MDEFFISKELEKHFSSDPSTVFDRIFSLEGENYRLVKARRTFRFELDGKGYFAKVHRGIGWKEILKEIFQFKLPVLGAENEYKAIRKLEEIGVPTMRCAAYGKRGNNPAKQHSFLVTDELKGMFSLEEFTDDSSFSPIRNKIYDVLADELGKMHSAGVNHRDCYICHFMLDPELACYGNIQLHVIDLHRARIRDKVPHRYLVKDLAGILFSSFHIKPTREEWMHFAQIYSKHLPHLSPEVNPSFWNKVTRTAIKLYKKEFKKLPVFE